LRTFDEWRAETAAKLLMLPDRGRIDTYVFDEQRQLLAAKLQTVNLGNLAHFLIDLHRFCDLWRISPEELFPTIDEIIAWFKEQA